MASARREIFDRCVVAARRAFSDDGIGFICPLCLRAFVDTEQVSLEHAPPKRAGGLAKYDYPPDHEEKAIELVLEQAELFATEAAA
jgi:Domain of unknown function (DUF3387)